MLTPLLFLGPWWDFLGLRWDFLGLGWNTWSFSGWGVAALFLLEAGPGRELRDSEGGLFPSRIFLDLLFVPWLSGVLATFVSRIGRSVIFELKNKWIFPGVLNVHRASSSQSQYFVKHFWHVPLTVGLLLQLLCSPTGNITSDRKQNKTSRLSGWRRLYSNRILKWTTQSYIALHCSATNCGKSCSLKGLTYVLNICLLAFGQQKQGMSLTGHYMYIYSNIYLWCFWYTKVDLIRVFYQITWVCFRGGGSYDGSALPPFLTSWRALTRGGVGESYVGLSNPLSGSQDMSSTSESTSAGSCFTNDCNAKIFNFSRKYVLKWMQYLNKIVFELNWYGLKASKRMVGVFKGALFAARVGTIRKMWIGEPEPRLKFCILRTTKRIFSKCICI